MEKVVFVTGSNKGIGFGIIKHLGLSGWRVVLGARDKGRAEGKSKRPAPQPRRLSDDGQNR